MVTNVSKLEILFLEFAFAGVFFIYTFDPLVRVEIADLLQKVLKCRPALSLGLVYKLTLTI